MTSLASYAAARYPTPRRALMALDLDGTLLLPDQSIPPSAIRALSEAVDRGAAVVITTGRRYRAAIEPLRDLPWPCFVLSHNGALLKDPHTHETIERIDFPAALLGVTWQAILAEGLAPVAHLDRFGNPPEIWSIPADPGTYHAEVLTRRYDGLVAIAPPEHLPPGPVIQLLAFGSPEATSAAADHLDRQFPGALYLHAMQVPPAPSFVLEVLDPAGGKWPGVQRIAAACGIPLSRVVAVGDDANDLPMLRGAAIGVAMGNATAAALAAADVRVAANDADGIAEAVQTCLLPLLD